MVRPGSVLCKENGLLLCHHSSPYSSIFKYLKMKSPCCFLLDLNWTTPSGHNRGQQSPFLEHPFEHNLFQVFLIILTGMRAFHSCLYFLLEGTISSVMNDFHSGIETISRFGAKTERDGCQESVLESKGARKGELAAR